MAGPPEMPDGGTWGLSLQGTRGRDKVLNGAEVSSTTVVRESCWLVWEGSQGEGWYRSLGELGLGGCRGTYSSENISGCGSRQNLVPAWLWAVRKCVCVCWGWGHLRFQACVPGAVSS